MYGLFTILSVVLNIPLVKHIVKRLQEEGYYYPYSERSTKKKLRDVSPFIALVVLPIVHLATVIIGMATFGNKKNREDIYQELKQLLIKEKVILDNKVVKADVKIDGVDIEDDVKIEEPPVRTYQDAQAYWYSKHNSHEVPTLFQDDEEEIDHGFQKRMGTRR